MCLEQCQAHSKFPVVGGGVLVVFIANDQPGPSLHDHY